MSADATNSSTRGMDCDRVAREDVVEGYLTQRLSDDDRRAFEEHYFECAQCFDDLRALQGIRAELQRERVGVDMEAARPIRRWAPGLGLAAAAVLAVAALVWMRPAEPPVSPASTTASRTPTTPVAEQPSSEPQGSAVAPQPLLQQLARVEPARYERPTLRGGSDPATERFQRGMEHYVNGQYQEAVDDLRAAAALDPDAAHIRFFLGVSYLLSRQDAAAIDRLRATIALGDSPYLEEAHFYLAKAYLRRHDLDAAERELLTVVRLRGSWSDEARRLLTQVERLKQPPH